MYTHARVHTCRNLGRVMGPGPWFFLKSPLFQAHFLTFILSFFFFIILSYFPVFALSLSSVWASLVAQMVKNLLAIQETQDQTLGWEELRKIPWRRKWQPTPVFLPGEFHGQRRLEDPSPWGHKESDTSKQLTVSLLFTCHILSCCCHSCSVAKLCLTLQPYGMCSMPGSLALHCLLEFAQIQVHWVSDAT